MTEEEQRERAELGLQDPETWDWEHAVVVDKHTRAGAVVAVRFEGGELERISEAADRHGVRITQFIHDSVLAYLRQMAG